MQYRSQSRSSGGGFVLHSGIAQEGWLTMHVGKALCASPRPTPTLPREFLLLP